MIPPCIFCFTNIEFTREHVIPEAIGGSLFLDETVCRRCNSWLGANVDVELLKIPETIDAFEALGIEYDRERVLNRHYEAVGSARGIEIRGRLGADGFRFHPQAVAGGSMVYPEDQAWTALRKSFIREERGSATAIDAELARLKKTHDAAFPDESVYSEPLGLTVVKRSHPLDVELRPRSAPRLAPVMAKIAYEFLFLIAGGRPLLAPENEQAINVLFGLIKDRPSDGGDRCIRLAPPGDGFEDVHGVRFERGTNSCSFRVILFGNVHHLLIIPYLCEGILDEVSTAAKQEVRGVEYLQRVTTGAKWFRALTPEGSAIRLPVG